MASNGLHEEDLTCTVCWDIFTDPVVLSCSHSVCKGCLENYWSEKEENECPLCRRRSSRDDPPVCLPLKNLCEAFSKERARPEEWCSEHSERFKLFCKDDKELICVVCRDSRKHKSHNCSPIEEAAKEIKAAEIEKALKPLEDKLWKFQNMESTCQSMAEHIKRQAEKAEPLIKKGFEKLRSFLEEEEKKLLNNLKKEEEKKTKLVEEKKDSMSKKIKSLSSKIKTIKKEMEEMESITFLREFEDVMKRALGDTEEEAEDLSGCLIDMPKHVGNLTFEIWRSMRNICPYSPVLLNPNTSCSLTVLSDDLTTVENTYGRLNLPSNPERISCVLGSEPVIDYHYVWEVQVNAHKYWDIGVIKAKKVEGADLWSRVTCLRSRSEQFSSTARHSIEVAGTSTPLTLDEPPETVRVELDQEEGTLSFYDGKSKLLHALEHDFTEDVLPFFDSYHQKEPVKFLPIDPWISLDPCGYMLMV